MALAFISYIFKTFIGGAITFIKGAVIFVGEGSSAIKRSFKTATIFIGKRSLAIGGRSFEAARAELHCY